MTCARYDKATQDALYDALKRLVEEAEAGYVPGPEALSHAYATLREAEG